MTSSSSSSSSLRLVGLAAALALCACRGARPAPPAAPVAEQAAAPAASHADAPADAPTPGPRLALFPVQNLSGTGAPLKELTAALRAQLARSGITLVGEEEVLRVLAARRVRYTGGIDRETAVALRDEAGVEGVLIASIETWVPAAPYRLAMTTRLVSTDPEPVIRWLHAYARTGIDSPGLLGMEIAPGLQTLRDQAFDQVAASLRRSLREHRPTATPCPERGSLAPSRQFRSPLAADPERRTIAVLPFVNDARRRDAGEVVALRVLAPLLAAGTIQVVEPGVVRAEMLAHRIGAAGGISLDDAQVMLELLRADLVLSGTVRTFEDAAGSSGAPAVDFSAWVLDRVTGELVWSSTTSAAGDDGVFFFGLGRVTTASGLACSMARGLVGPLLGGRPPSGTGDPQELRRPPDRWRGNRVAEPVGNDFSGPGLHRSGSGKCVDFAPNSTLQGNHAPPVHPPRPDARAPSDAVERRLRRPCQGPRRLRGPHVGAVATARRLQGVARAGW